VPRVQLDGKLYKDRPRRSGGARRPGGRSQAEGIRESIDPHETRKD
jgi:hypothetical protein